MLPRSWQGSVVAGELLALGHNVRAIVRDVDKAKALASHGADLLVGELSDVGFLTRSMRGADGAFLLLPPPAMDTSDVRALQEHMANVQAAAVAESGIRHVVLLSSWGAEKPAGTGPIVGLHLLEEALKKTGAISTFLRAGSFTENLLNMLPAAQHQGVRPSFFPPEHKLATSDVYRTYNTTARGVDRLVWVHDILDLAPYGRQEDWEDSPPGWPQLPTYG